MKSSEYEDLVIISDAIENGHDKLINKLIFMVLP